VFEGAIRYVRERGTGRVEVSSYRGRGAVALWEVPLRAFARENNIRVVAALSWEGSS
jgi:hypothetical protein